jgi:hypothetical protein
VPAMGIVSLFSRSCAPMSIDLAATVKDLRTFVPAKDFALSRRFYAELGWKVEPITEKLAEVRLGGHGFLLQDYFVEAWANNFMMQLTVDDLDAWWRHISTLDLAGRYGVRAPTRRSSSPGACGSSTSSIPPACFGI